jgi:predicted nucleotidyltransferase
LIGYHALLAVKSSFAARGTQPMNDQAQWRLAFAHTLRVAVQQFTDITSLAVLGSVARGYCDQFSDLELLLVWKQSPNQEQQASLVHALQADHRYPPFDPGYQSAFRIQDIPVDLWHTTVAQEERFLHTVLHDLNLDLVANNRLDTLHSCIPLFGAKQLLDWKTRIDAYPTELALRFIEAFIPHFHLRQLNLAAYRGNPTTFYHMLSDIQCSLFVVLLALNRSYFPTFKWMYPRLGQLARKPPQLVARLQSMFEEPASDAAGSLRAVLSETLGMVESAYPQVDTAYARYGLEQQPQCYSAPAAV